MGKGKTEQHRIVPGKRCIQSSPIMKLDTNKFIHKAFAGAFSPEIWYS